MLGLIRGSLWRQCMIHTQRNSKLASNTVSRINLSNSSVVRFHFSSQPQTLEKISNYENLFTRISSSDSIADILKIYKEHEDIYKCEHLATTARSFARLVTKQPVSKSEQEFLKDPQYIQFSNKVANNLSSFNENELLDVLFWIRKFKYYKLSLANMESNQIDCMDRIVEYSKKNVYNVKQLTSIHFDISHIGRNCDDICYKLIQEINKDQSQLTPFICMNLMQSISLKQGFNTGRELILIDLISKLLPNIYDQLDLAQKTLIFKCIAFIEPQISPPKYKIPHVMFMIKNDLKEKLDSLNEQNVLNILSAYQYLIYSQFPQDLLEEIKEMIVVTVKHNPKNMKSNYLLDYLEYFTLLNKKKKTEAAKMNILINELTKRIQEKDESLLYQKLDKLTLYCDKYIKSNSSLIVELVKYYEGKIKQNYNQFLLELASKKAPLENFDRLLEAFFGQKTTSEKIEVLNKLSKPQQIRFYVSLYNHRDRHNDLFQAMGNLIEEIVENDTLVVLISLKLTTIFNQQKKDLMIKAVQKYIQNRSNDTDGQVARAMVSSIEFKETRKLWTTSYLKNKSVDTQLIHKFVEQFFAQDSYDNQEKLLFLTNILLLSKPYPSKLFVNLMKENTKFLQEVSKYDSVFRKMLSQLLESLRQNPEHIRLINIYQICLRLESINLRLDHFYKFMGQVFEICVQNNKKSEMNSYIGFMYQIKLVENNSLKPEHAKTAFENMNIADIYHKGKLLSLVAKHDTQFFNTNKEQYDIYFQHLLSQMNQNQTTMVLNSIASILRMPIQYLRSEHKFVMKSLKEHIHSSNDQCYTNIFTAIPYKGGDLYTPIVKEMIAHFPQIVRRLNFPEVRRILQKVVELNIQDHQLLTIFLQIIGSNFYTMSCEDRVMSMQAFCKLRIRQDDFIEKCLRMYIDNMTSYRSYYVIIVDSLFKVGYYSETLSEFLKKAMRFWRFSSAEYMNTLCLLAITKERQGELLNDISMKLQNPSSYLESRQNLMNYQQFCLNTLYYNQFHQAHPEILKFLQKPYVEESKITYPAKFIVAHNCYQIIHRYLSAMGIEYLTNTQVDKYEVPLYIPDQKILIKVNSSTNLNFDRKTLDGKSIIENALLESIPDTQVVVINIPEFMSLGNDYLQKINFLIKQGIKSKNTGVYDFSKFQAAVPEEEKEEVVYQQSYSQDDIQTPAEEDLLNVDVEEHQTTKN